MNSECFIYAIIHITSGKRYVGSTSNTKRRWVEHRADLRHNHHHCTYLQNAWNKYGEAAFEFVILETIENATKEQRIAAELRLIAEKPHYNLRIAGINFTNFVNGPLSRQRQAATMAIKYETDSEYRALMSAIGAKVAALAKTPEARAKMSIQTKALWQSKTHRKRVSDKLAVFWSTPGVKDAHSERVKAIKNTPEARKRNSEITKIRWSDPLRNRKQTRWADPEAKERQAAKMRAYHASRRAAANQLTLLPDTSCSKASTT